MSIEAWAGAAALALFCIHLIALGYTQFASRRLLSDTAAAARDGHAEAAAYASESATGSARARRRAVRELAREARWAAMRESLPAPIRTRLARYVQAVAITYGSFALLVAVWLGGLLLSG